jgi:hypothetical protein
MESSGPEESKVVKVSSSLYEEVEVKELEHLSENQIEVIPTTKLA